MSRENTATASVTGLVTADELLLMGEGRRELIRGEVLEYPYRGMREGLVIGNIAFSISDFVRDRKLGHSLARVGYHLEHDPDTVRAPDASFIARGRVKLTDGYPTVAPDLAVEVKSPGDTYEDLQAKARFWLDHGTRLVWVALPEKRVVEVHEKGKTLVQLSEGDEDVIDGGDVLPGFRLAVRECFSTRT